MPRLPSPAWIVPAALLTAAAALPVSAQTTAGSETPRAGAAITSPAATASPVSPSTPAPSEAADAAPAPSEPSAASSNTPSADAAQSDTASSEAPQAAPPAEQSTAPAPAETADATPPPPPVDPLLAAVRDRAAAAGRNDGAEADRKAVTAFYAERMEPVWVTPEGFTVRARHAMAEIAKADDWGLEAKAFALPQLSSGAVSTETLADAEVALSLAVLKYARHARGGRLEPTQLSRNFDYKPPVRDPKDVMAAVAGTETPGESLRGLHPKHRQFHLLRQALLKERAQVSVPEDKEEPHVQIPEGPILRAGMKHQQVVLLRERLAVASDSGEEESFDSGLETALKAFQSKNGVRPTGAVGRLTRAALNGDDKSRPSNGSQIERIALNMERWRWLPEDLGQFHIWNNVPEYQSRVVKGGRTIHQTKIIVGKPQTQTTLFTANMRHLVFGPEWGVPDSIKVKELLPYLRPTSGDFFGWGGGTDTRVLQRHNLRVSYNGKPVDPSQVDWTRVDIRRFTFIQPTGPTNVLGAIKFMFPNKHDIYMHDTPQRSLFNSAVRAYSHGCIRTQDPALLAEIILQEDQGMSATQVRQLYARGGNNEVRLTKHIPVHNTYFTVVAGENGKLETFADLYGHDRRIAAALSGRPMALEEPSVSSAPPRERQARPRPYKQTGNDWLSGLLGN